MFERIAYHVSRLGARHADDMIEPGQFGRDVREFGQHARRDWLFEAIRVAEFPEKVSRLHANFAWLTPDAALTYASGAIGIAEEAWVVEIGRDTPVTVADTLWLHGSDDPSHDDLYWQTAAHHYWAGEPTAGRLPEMVIGGPIRLLHGLSKG